jgi:hypothetical protein
VNHCRVPADQDEVDSFVDEDLEEVLRVELRHEALPAVAKRSCAARPRARLATGAFARRASSTSSW